MLRALNVIVVEPALGSNIYSAVKESIALAKQLEYTVLLLFNGVYLRITAFSDESTVIKEYQTR